MFVPNVPNNDHLKNIEDFFGSITPGAIKIPTGTKFIFLCYTNRCGSNYVAELFASSGAYNLAGEDLNFDTVVDHSTSHGFKNFQEYFCFLVNMKTKSEVFFLKVAPPHLQLLEKAGILDQINSDSRFVLIERADKLSQAVSFAIAFATGKFTSSINGHTDEKDLKFSADLINNILNGLVENYKMFDLFFAKNGIVPTNINYEQLVDSPAQYLDMINRHLGLDGLSVVPEHVRIERQAGAINALWRDLYLKTA